MPLTMFFAVEMLKQTGPMMNIMVSIGCFRFFWYRNMSFFIDDQSDYEKMDPTPLWVQVVNILFFLF